MTPSLDPVLVTGCSSGIGWETAAYLLKGGHTVYATARDPQALTALADAGAHVLRLDVTDETSMTAAVSAVEAEHGRVGTLVNNAGYGVYGAIEEVDLDAVRRMFETNVFGLARMTQLVLPAMRAAGAGRIVNIGSMGGRVAFPIGGYYHASKYAVEALSDSLRAEVRPFGIDVVLIEPGPVRTSFEDTINASLEGPAPDDASPYTGLVDRVRTTNAGAYQSRLLSVEPSAVARTVFHAVEAKRPRSRYVVTATARALVHTRRLGGDRAWDAVVRRQLG